MKDIRNPAIILVVLSAVFFSTSFSFANDEKKRIIERITKTHVFQYFVIKYVLSEKVKQEAVDVVKIYSSSHTGSGFVVRDRKRNRFLIFSAWHVVMKYLLKNPEDMKIEHSTTKQELKLKNILVYSKKHDVFVGVLESYDGPGLTLSEYPDYNSDDMFIFGFPYKLPAIHWGRGIDLRPNPHFGIVIDTGADLSGNSGGPILDNEGKVTGILHSGKTIYGAFKTEHLMDLLFSANTSKVKWEEAGFSVIEKPVKEAISYIRTLESDRNQFRRPMDFQDNLPRLKQIADEGSPVAQLELSRILRDLGNIEEAVKYLRMAAQGGYFEAMIDWAEELYKGKTVPQDKLEAAKWLLLVSEIYDKTLSAGFAMFRLTNFDMLRSAHSAMVILVQILEKEDAILQNIQDIYRAWSLQEQVQHGRLAEEPSLLKPSTTNNPQNRRCYGNFSLEDME